jgi:hypothetical protein
MANEVLIFIVKNQMILMLGGGGGRGKDSRENEGLSMRVRGV